MQFKIPTSDAAMERYIKFLYPTKLEGRSGDKSMSVPALDVVLMWHSHQLDAVNYHKMSRFMFPDETDEECIIDHDDSICFKEMMKKYRVETKVRWTKTYGHNDHFQGRAFGKILHSPKVDIYIVIPNILELLLKIVDFEANSIETKLSYIT